MLFTTADYLKRSLTKQRRIINVGLGYFLGNQGEKIVD